MSFESLLNDVRARDSKPIKPTDPNAPRRAQSIFRLSVKQRISTDEADAQTLVGDILVSNKLLDDSPIYQGVDELLDVFDPSEAPAIDKEDAPPDPMGELLKAEVKMAASVTKGFLKGMGFIFSPIERAFKFGTNALMYDPLTKSAAGPVKRTALFVAIEAEKTKQIRELEKKRGIGFDILADPAAAQPQLPQEDLDRINAEVDKMAVELIRQTNSEIEELEPVKPSDFGNSIKDALKATVPWPGFADDVKTAGEIGSDSFARITGRDAPWYYAPASDIVTETVAMSGLIKIAAATEAGLKVKGVAGGINAARIARAAKLTKREVRAIKRLHKAGSQVKKVPPKTFLTGITTLTPVEKGELIDKFIGIVKSAAPFKKTKEVLKFESKQRSLHRVAILKKNIQGDFRIATMPDITPPMLSIERFEFSALVDMVGNSTATFDKGKGIGTILDILMGIRPDRSAIVNLEPVFGSVFTKVLLSKRSIKSIAVDVTLDLVNLPRAVLASYDLSAGGRQGIIFAVSHPVASMKALGRSVRAAKDPHYAEAIERATRTSGWGKMATASGVHSSPIGVSARITAKEEAYMSNIADFIPGVSESGIAFTTYLNQIRREVFKGQAQKWIKRGITPKKNPLDFEQYANFINHGTGRGSLEQLSPEALTALNFAFFSPRLQVSRFQVLGDVFSPKTTRNARKAIARDLAEFFATGLGILGMMKMAGAEVETDWRSSDFGKVKVGNTRYNYWGPFLPIATLIGRVIAGEIKVTGTGKIKDKSRIESTLRFFRTKLAPVPGLAVDVFVGETLMGDEVEATKEFIGKRTIETFAPLVMQDIRDAWRFQGFDGQLPITSGLAFTGIGVQTWELAPFQELELAKDSLARQTYGKNYSQLSFSEVQFLDMDILINYPGLVELELKSKFDINSASAANKRAQSQRLSEIRLNKRLDKDVMAAFDEVLLKTGHVPRTVGSWRLNNAQYKEYEKRVAAEINKIFADNKSFWDAKGEDGRRMSMVVLLRNAKAQAAQDMKIGIME